MNSAVFTSKTMHMWHPVAPEDISSRWEQFYDWYFPQLPTKYVPRKVSSEETISWVFFTEKLPLTDMGCFSEVFSEENIFLDIYSQKQIPCDLFTFFASCKVKKTVGRFQSEAPRARGCIGMYYSKYFFHMCLAHIFWLTPTLLSSIFDPHHSALFPHHGKIEALPQHKVVCIFCNAVAQGQH